MTKKYFFQTKFSTEPGSVNTIEGLKIEREFKFPYMNNIPKGAIINISYGEYSDYRVDQTYKALEEISCEDLLKVYLWEHPEQKELYKFRGEQFMEFVEEKGLLEKLETWEWHISDYSSAESMSVTNQRS